MSTRRVDSASRLGESTRRVHKSRRGETRRVGLLGYTDEARRGELRCRLVRGEAILTTDSLRRGAVAPDSSRLVSPRLGKTRRTDGYIRYVENDSACHQNAI